MRVLIAHSEYRARGGEERHVDLLEQGLSECGVEVIRHQPVSPSNPGIRRKLVLGCGLAYRPRARRAIGDMIRRGQPDVVHFHNLLPELTASSVHAAASAGCATVMTVHNYRLFCPGGTLFRHGVVHDDCVRGSSLVCGVRGSRESLAEGLAYGVALEVNRRLRLIDRWTDAFVMPSQFVATTVARAGFDQSKMRVIYNGVERTAAAPTAAGAYALFVGRLSEEKGVGTLLRAAELCPEIPIRIVGEGGGFPSPAPRNVVFSGHAHADAVSRLRADSAFAVVPSLCHEAFSLAAAESLSAGKPVIATPSGGLREVVDSMKNGLFVAPGDSAALAAAMRLLWQDEALRLELSYGALRSYEERFTLERQVDEVLALYEELTSARRHELALVKEAS